MSSFVCVLGLSVTILQATDSLTTQPRWRRGLSLPCPHASFHTEVPCILSPLTCTLQASQGPQSAASSAL